MSTKLDEHAYKKLIDENILALNKYMPKHSLEKKHIIAIMEWSIKEIYHKYDKNPINIDYVKGNCNYCKHRDIYNRPCTSPEICGINKNNWELDEI